MAERRRLVAYLDGLPPYSLREPAAGTFGRRTPPSLSKIPLLLAGRAAQAETEKELRLRMLMLSILDRAFKGEL
jgi:hypothetical protein